MLRASDDEHAARPILLALLAIGGGALVAAFVSQYAFGLEPCVLCLWQRVPYAVVAVLAGVALVAGRPVGRTSALAVAAMIFTTGALLAFYHVGVQQHWWASAIGCGGEPVSGMSIDDLSPAALARPPKRCDEVDWRLLGLSLAGWNTIASAALAAGCVAGLTFLSRIKSR